MFATYFVPQENVPSLLKKLDALAKKAKKLGCSPVTYETVKTFSAPHPDPKRAVEGEIVVYEAVTVKGEAPSLSGWTFAATLDHVTLPDGKSTTLIRSHGEESLPERFRTATPEHCDHCGTSRRRNSTFVVRGESGEWQQVGRQCLKDFLGYHRDPGALARYASALLDLDLLMAEAYEGGGDGTYVAYDLGTFLALALSSIEDCGWLSRSKAREMVASGGTSATPTADAVWHYLDSQSGTDRDKWRIPKPPEAIHAEVKEALEWLADQDSSDNDYIYNCQVIAELGCVTFRTAGYAASIVSSHRRAKDRQLRREVLTANGTAHVGTVGKREEFCLTLLSVVGIEGYYGVTYLHKFMDPEGNQVVWFASNPLVVSEPHDLTDFLENPKEALMIPQKMVVGASYRVKATVKEHGDYEGQAQTKVARLAVQPLSKPKKKRKSRKKAKKGVDS
jgi:hypothetical protein